MVVWKQLKEKYSISKRISVYNILPRKDYHNVKFQMKIKKMSHSFNPYKKNNAQYLLPWVSTAKQNNKTARLKIDTWRSFVEIIIKVAAK